MQKSKFNESQRLAVIAEQDAGKPVEHIYRQQLRIRVARTAQHEKDVR
jgi:hypothetical protein